MAKSLSINGKARRDCVRHWKRMLDLTEKDFPSWRDAPITENCKFCNLYFNNKCDGCPVMAATGLSYCDGTPYESAFHAYDNIMGRLLDGETNICLEDFHSCVQQEIKFLESLEIK